VPDILAPDEHGPFQGTLSQWHTDRGISVWKQGGVWYQAQEPFWGNETTSGVKDADVVPAAIRPGGERTDNTDRDRYLFFGGHVYTVSAGVAAELIDAGYSVSSPVVVGPGDPARWNTIGGTWADQTATWTLV
jgi:hypothetical protein